MDNTDEYMFIQPQDSCDHGKTVRFLPARRWKGLRELHIVAEDIGHPQLIGETFRYICWVTLGRQQTIRRVPIGDQRVELKGYLVMRLSYPTVHNENVRVEECARSDPA